MPPDAQVAWIAARQDGVIDFEQLAACGVDRWAVQRRVAAGWLHRKYRGVFAVGHPGLTQRGEWRAAVVACGPTAALSHRSAAVFWGLANGASKAHVTVPGGRHGPADIVVHAGHLPGHERMIIDGLRVTTIARTLLDCAETATTKELVGMIDRATAHPLFDAQALRNALKHSVGRKGLKRLREALLITRPQDVLTRSELERRALKLIKDAKLPVPEVNVKVGRFEVDLLWRKARLVVELDSREHHGTWAAQERDRRRDLELVAQGWTTARLTWRHVVNEPSWVAGQLRRKLGA